MIFAVIFVLTVLSTTEIRADPSCPATDGQDSVYIPDEDCTKFWQCSNGTPYLFDCPAGLNFNPTLNVCDWPDQAGCNSSGDDSDGSEDSNSSDDSSSSGSSEVDDGVSGEDDNDNSASGNDSNGDDDDSDSGSSNESRECPSQDGEESVYIPDEDCGKFWQCSNGVAYQQDCPAGLHFNPSLNVCDWPDQAGCSSGSGSDEDSDSSGSNSSGGESEENEGDDEREEDSNVNEDENENSKEGDDQSGGDDSSSSSESNEGSSGGSGSIEGSECPAKDGEESVYIPDADCGKFWQCSNGVAYQQDCPAGLHFNPSLNVCDWPDQAGCNSGSGSDEDSESSSSNSSGADSEENDENNNEGDDESEEDSNVNEDENENSNEDDDQSGGGDSSSSSESNEGSSGGSGSIEGSECPAKDGEESVYIPDADCGKFWQCSNGVAYQQDCPAGLHFNPSLNVCDWPDQAGCNSGSSSEEDSGENPTPGDEPSEEDNNKDPEPGSEEDTGSEGDDNSSSSSSSESDEGDRECPARDGEQSVYFPDDDCGKFWQCSNGVAYQQNCPAGLHFNPSLNVCDWPDQAGCDGDSSSSSSSSSEEDSNDESQESDGNENQNEENNGSGNDGDDSNEGSDSGSDSSGSGSGSSESSEGPECPARDGADAVYIPHEDCTKFWQCSNGTPYLFDCPANLNFNPNLNVCDWPEQAGCTGK